MSSSLTLEELAILDRVEARPDLQVYFFGKVKQLKWFDELNKRGFLDPSNNPIPQQTAKGYYTIPQWPVCEYLVNSSEHLNESENSEYAKKYLKFIRGVTRYSREVEVGNERTWWKFSQLLRNIPIELINEEDIGNLSYWLDDPFGSDLVVGELIGWLAELQQEPTEVAVDLSLKLLPVLFEIKTAPCKYSPEKNEATLKFQSYQLTRFIDSLASDMGESIGERVTDFFSRCLEEVLEISGDDGWSVLWRPAIEEHDQNTKQDEANVFFVEALRASMEGLCKDSSVGGNGQTSKLLESDYQTLQRIGLHIAGEFFEILPREVIDVLLQPKFFEEGYRHETWMFLNKNFNKLILDKKEKVFSIIEGLTPSVENGEPAKEAIAYRQSLWLVAIKDQDQQALERYQKCLEVSGVEPEHPSFASYHTTTVGVTNDSPIDSNELRVLLESPSEFVSVLNDYEPTSRFNEPDIEGLIAAVSSLILSEKEALFEGENAFASLKPYFLYAILYSFTNEWGNKGEQDSNNWNVTWPRLLSFIKEIVKLGGFWECSPSTSAGGYIGNTSTVVGEIGRLIEAGCKKDEHAFGVENIERSKDIIEALLEKQVGEIFNKDSSAVSKAINSPRGKCLEAYINLALYECRNKPGNGSDNAEIWSRYVDVFDEELSKGCDQGGAEFSTIVAMFLANFRYLSKSWVIENLEKIFDQSDHLRWLCAMQGYSYVGGFDSATYNLFKNRGDFLAVLDDEYLSDKMGERYTQLMCIAYLRGEDTLEEKNSLISALIKRADYEELNKLIWFVWTLRKSSDLKTQQKVYELWPKLLELVDGTSKEGRQLASGLCHWAAYITDLNGEPMSWLLKVAPYAQENHNAYILLESLARLSDEFPFEIGKVWKEMLTNRLDDYPDEAIKTMFRNLISEGSDGKRLAKDIASSYMAYGASRPNEWLNELLVVK